MLALLGFFVNDSAQGGCQLTIRLSPQGRGRMIYQKYMNENQKSHIYKFSVNALTNPEQADRLRTLVTAIPNVERLDMNMEKRLIRVISSEPLEPRQLNILLNPSGFHLQAITTSTSASPATQGTSKMNVCVDGMTCRSCEITVERKWKKLAGVKKVHVNASTGKAELIIEGNTPTVSELERALGDDKYRVHQNFKKVTKAEKQFITDKRPSFWRLVGLFALVLLIGRIFSDLGLLNTNFSLGNATSFGAIFLIGLVAASSSCIAITGGLLLSAAAKFNERYASARPLARMRPVFLFLSGRIVSYTVLGGVLGIVGAALSPSPTVTAIIAIVAALYMLIMGLDMLHIAPSWLKSLIPRMSKSLSHRIMDAEGKEHPIAPFGLGAATFFLPCGFTQALQLYALTTGSFGTGAITMLAFALGTAPALLALGWASSSLKGKAGKFFLQFSGALVIVLGLWNIQNGLTVLGHPISLPSFNVSSPAIANSGGTIEPIVMDGNTQVIKMKMGYAGYEPNHFTVRAGTPVRWEVDGDNAGGCTNVLVSRQLGIQQLLKKGQNIIAFTPQTPGEVQFSCSMGMVRGSITVLPSV